MPADLAIVVLAAGKGTRLKSERAKVLHQAGGRRARAGSVGVGVGHQADVVRAAVEPFGARTVVQRPQLGTGHAVAQALKALPRSRGRVLILPGDAPLLRPETLQALVRAHADQAAAATGRSE